MLPSSPYSVIEMQGLLLIIINTYQPLHCLKEFKCRREATLERNMLYPSYEKSLKFEQQPVNILASRSDDEHYKSESVKTLIIRQSSYLNYQLVKTVTEV